MKKYGVNFHIMDGIVKTVRTRFAPSPTGYMHVGNLRTALYAYLIAKQAGGSFILRIEDTDQQRLVEGAADIIYDTLAQTGLAHDEGPDIGGPYGPYVQSQRHNIYIEHAKMLVDKGAAYYCFCGKSDDASSDDSDAVDSKIPPKYDGKCFHLTPSQAAEKLASGAPYVIRQRMPQCGSTTFTDEVYGVITVDNSELEDQILIKSDGFPTYNFANVVDDHLMGITHVIRGSEYLSSTPKYNLLYEAFGWEIPRYVHCAPVMKDASHKLSKRNGDASYGDLIAKGFLKEALLNYIALLGWSPKGENEIFTLAELVQAFSISGLSKAPAIFDNEKLEWLNSEYIRALDAQAFHDIALPYIKNVVNYNVDFLSLSLLLQKRCKKLTDIPEQIDFIDALPDYDISLYVHKKMKTTPQSSLDALRAILPVLRDLSEWNVECIHDAMMTLVGELGVKNGQVLWPLRTAVSGKPVTPGGGVELAYLVGREQTLSRIENGIRLLEQSI